MDGPDPHTTVREILMMNSAIGRTALVFFVILGVIVSSFAFAIRHHDESVNRIQFRLQNHNGETLSQQDLGGRHLVVFFGFTSCHDVCPAQMSKLTAMMEELDRTGHGDRIRPIFISVDPERDTPEKIAKYLENFDDRFVGLTGTRTALNSAANSFKTLLQELSPHETEDYQITHSSITYIIDPFSRIVDYIPGAADHRAMADKVRETI